MRQWTRNVFLADHDLQERVRTEIVRRWPEAKCPLHIRVMGEEGTAIEVRVWSDTGVHIFEEAVPEDFSASRRNDPTVIAVLHAVELALSEAANETLDANQGVS